MKGDRYVKRAYCTTQAYKKVPLDPASSLFRMEDSRLRLRITHSISKAVIKMSSCSSPLSWHQRQDAYCSPGLTTSPIYIRVSWRIATQMLGISQSESIHMISTQHSTIQ